MAKLSGLPNTFEGDVRYGEASPRRKALGKTIEESPESGPRVAEIRLWYFLTWDMRTDDEWDAVRAEDVERSTQLFQSKDYAEQMTLAAIKALRTEARA